MAESKRQFIADARLGRLGERSIPVGELVEPTDGAATPLLPSASALLPGMFFIRESGLPSGKCSNFHPIRKEQKQRNVRHKAEPVTSYNPN